MLTTHLGLKHIETHQDQKEHDLNENSDKVAAAVGGLTGKNLSATVFPLTLTQLEARAAAFKFTSAAAAGTVKAPVAYCPRTFVVWNASGWPLTVTTDQVGSAGVTVPDGFVWTLFHDGAHVYPVGPPITAAQQPLFCNLYHSASQSLPNAAWTTLTWNTEDADTGGLHNNTNPTRVTLPGGVFTGGVQVVFNAPGAGTVRGVRVKLNGAATSLMGISNLPPVSGGNYTVISTPLRARLYAAGDYVEVDAYQDSGGALNAVADAATNFYCRFGMWRV